MEEVLEKTQTQQFFILCNNINFYKNVCDQKIYNRSGLVSYTAGYIYFIKTLNGIINWTNNRKREYIDNSQVDKKLVNQLRKSNFELKQTNKDHWSAAIQYTISGVFEQYFAIAIQKQKNNHNILIHQKWLLPLPDIRCRLKKIDFFLLPTLVMNKRTIPGFINMVQKLTKWLELLNKIMRDKFILFKGDLMTIRNCRHVIYRWQEDILPLNRFHWLEPMASFFYL